MSYKHRLRLYDLIESEPNCTMEAYADILGWRKKKTRRVLNELLVEVLVKRVESSIIPAYKCVSFDEWAIEHINWNKVDESSIFYGIKQKLEKDKKEREW